MKLTAVELFAGVGGFRLGLEQSGWETIWANQWEPSTKIQYAAECYLEHFPNQLSNQHFNTDISVVTNKLESDPSLIPEHALLVGGFPCQDYSVATTQAKGILGKKGVLWWDIEKIIRTKTPPYVLLENVDRLLVSPASQRGRDFGVLLGCFRDLGYSVEWRVINAADYGFPQKRKRTFIFASRGDTKNSKKLKKSKHLSEWILSTGLFANAFPVEKAKIEIKTSRSLNESIQDISNDFSFKFNNAGVMSDGEIYTLKVNPVKSEMCTLASILENNVSEEYFVSDLDINKEKGWKYVKGAKRYERTSKNGHVYNYAEGAIPFPEKLDSAARTILTGEGNKNPNRSTHLIKDPQNGRYRTLTPIEVERLNGFPDDWTNTGMPKSKRYFCMGNALVVGVVAKLGSYICELI